MPFRSTKTRSDQIYKIDNFEGGLKWDRNPESIANNEFTILENFEFDYQTGSLRTVDGVELIVDTSSTITSIFYTPIDGEILYSYTSSTVQYLAKTNVSGTISQVGKLNGVIPPKYVVFDEKVIISSGEMAQAYSSGTLSDIITKWSSSTVTPLYTLIVPKLPDSSGLYYVYECTTSGTTSNTEPTWVTTGTVTNGTAVFTRVTASYCPVSDFLFIRNGKLVVANRYDDYLYYSGTGDYTNWKQTTNEFDSQALPIGLKDGTNFVGIVPLTQDIIIYKSNTDGTLTYCYRVVGEYSSDVSSTWSVLEVSRTSRVANYLSLCAAPNTALYFGPQGLRGMQTTQAYGSVVDMDIGKAINPFLTENYNTDSARLWHVPSKNQVWLKTQSDTYIYIMSLSNNAFTTRKFKTELIDLSYSVDTVFVAMGTKICKLNQDIATELGENIKSILRTGIKVATDKFLFKRIFLNTYNKITGNGSLSIGNVAFGFTFGSGRIMIYNNQDLIYQNSQKIYNQSTTQKDVRCNTASQFLELLLTVESGSLILREMRVFFTEV